MNSYTIIRSKSGDWKIKEKRYFTTVAVVKGDYNEAQAKLREIKEADKKAAEEKKQRKAEVQKAVSQYEIEFKENGNAWKTGYTKSGKQFVLEGNCGLTERSRKCFSLYIDGIGYIFTSGTIEAAAEYILNN